MANNQRSPRDQNRIPAILVEDTITLKATAASGILAGAVEAQAVAIVDGSGAQITSFGGGTQYTNGAAQASPVGTVALGYDGTNVRALKTDSSGVLAVSATFSPSGTQDVNLTKVGGTGFALGQQLAAASLPIVLTAAQLTTLTPPTTVTVTQATASSLNATVVGTGTFAVQATLQTQTDTVMVGGVNIKEINAVTPLMGNGTTGTGSQRVTLSSDNTAIANWGLGATGSAVPSGAQYGGRLAKTALPTAGTDGNMVGAMADKFGRQVVLQTTIRDLIGTQTTTISASTSETTIVTAAASTFNDLLLLVISNTSATAARIDFRDTTAGSVLFSIYVPAGDTRGFNLGGVGLPQTSVNTNWTAQSSASVTDLRIYAVFAKNK